jgi:hypothetical protein
MGCETRMVTAGIWKNNKKDSQPLVFFLTEDWLWHTLGG